MFTIRYHTRQLKREIASRDICTFITECILRAHALHLSLVRREEKREWKCHQRVWDHIDYGETQYDIQLANYLWICMHIGDDRIDFPFSLYFYGISISRKNKCRSLKVHFAVQLRNSQQFHHQGNDTGVNAIAEQNMKPNGNDFRWKCRTNW